MPEPTEPRRGLTDDRRIVLALVTLVAATVTGDPIATATVTAVATIARRAWRVRRIRRIRRVGRLRATGPVLIRPIVREKLRRAEIPLLHDTAIVFLFQPHRLRDEPDVALEGEPFAPGIAPNRRAAARECARLKPIEAGHSVSGMRSRATSTRNVRVVLRRNGGPTCGS